MKLEFNKFDVKDFIDTPFEMTAIFGYEDSTYVQGKLIKLHDWIHEPYLVQLYDWKEDCFKTVSNEELDRIKFYCVVD